MEPTRIVHIVDDDDAVRQTTEFLLRSAGYETATYASGTEFLAAVDAKTRGCVLLDLRMPGPSGIEVQKALAEARGRIAVIVLTGHGDVSLAVQAMKAGAIDFIEKPYDDETLLAAIEHAFELIGQSKVKFDRQAEAVQRVEQLSRREREVLAGLLAGSPNKLIAFELGISPRTVEMHRANMMEKLGARSLSEAVRVAIDAGLMPETARQPQKDD